METSTLPPHSKKRPGRPAGISPSRYNHALLRDKVNSNRELNIKAICQGIQVSRPHFYDVINGRTPSSPQLLTAIAKALDLSPMLIFQAENNLPKV